VIEIHLATYNGDRFLSKFFASLLGQSDQNFLVRVRDDGSSDATLSIIEQHKSLFGSRMDFVPDREPSGSAKANFARLMSHFEGDYLLWADQDDIWRPDKVAILRNLLSRAEDDFGADSPIYAFTDATPTDIDLSPLANSFFAYKKIDPNAIRHLRSSLVCAPMMGCVSGINRALHRVAHPIPVNEVTGHDWWCHLIAAGVGNVVYSREPTVLYRQHDRNVSHQQRNSLTSYLAYGGKVARVRRGLKYRWSQARALLDRIDGVGNEVAQQILEDFLKIENMDPLSRRLSLVRGKFLYNDFNRNLAMLLLC
jgi:glycosyltransferase involved in cell wall biosynthesis